MNLPNALTLGRIVAAPLLAVLPFQPAWQLRFAAAVLFVLAAVTDYYDGAVARGRNLVTDLGKLLDPLADKLLLLATLVPMYLLMGRDAERALVFHTPLGRVGLPAWVLGIVLGRELIMTLFRQVAARRGIVIAAIGPAKAKTALQSIWVGAAYFWFAAAAAAARYGWSGTAWRGAAWFAGTVGALAMAGAIVLTLYSLGLYVRRYGRSVATARR